MWNILTVDVEDWAQSTLNRDLEITKRVFDNTGLLLDLLGRGEAKATFFVLGLVAEKFPELVSRIARAGHEVATHGYGHRPIFTMAPHEFRQDLRKSITALEAITGKKVLGHRAPDYSIVARSLWALDVLKEEGLLYDSSIFPIRGRRYGIPGYARFPHCLEGFGEGLLEVPPSTFRFGGLNIPFGGGGYFRFLPYPVSQWAAKKLNERGERVVFYFHPYELDLSELRSIEPKVPLRISLSQGFNRRKSKEKIARLLSDFRFGSIRDVFFSENPPYRYV
jgi:polysaccharide deacetylase family protein (PEP-CTERM system associated)